MSASEGLQDFIPWASNFFTEAFVPIHNTLSKAQVEGFQLPLCLWILWDDSISRTVPITLQHCPPLRWEVEMHNLSWLRCLCLQREGLTLFWWLRVVRCCWPSGTAEWRLQLNGCWLVAVCLLFDVSYWSHCWLPIGWYWSGCGCWVTTRLTGMATFPVLSFVARSNVDRLDSSTNL